MQLHQLSPVLKMVCLYIVTRIVHILLSTIIRQQNLHKYEKLMSILVYACKNISENDVVYVSMHKEETVKKIMSVATVA